MVTFTTSAKRAWIVLMKMANASASIPDARQAQFYAFVPATNQSIGEDMATPEEVFAILASVDSPEGRRRLADYLASTPFPHYEPAANGTLVRISVNGERTLGRFIGREFVPHESKQR